MFRLFLPLLAFLIMSEAARAVTAAWKVPLNTIVENPEATPAFKKLEKPPGESAFFQEGDELWDLSGALEWTKREKVETEDPFETEAYETKPLIWAGDWIVWNERSKMVIASGNPVDLRDTEVVIGYQDLPVVIRTRCELVAGEGGGTMRFISLASRNGASVKASSDGMTMEIGCESSPGGWSDLRCQLSWPAQGEEGTWNVSTAVTIENGKRTLLARQGQGAGCWQLFGTISMESFDGTPQSETRWIESSRGLKPWGSGPRLLHPIRMPLNNDLHLGVFPVPEDLVERLGYEDRKLAYVKPPVEVDTWAWVPLMGMKEVLAQNGVTMNAEGSFAGFDLRGFLVVISTAESVDLVEQLVQSTGEPPRQIWVEANPEAGGWGIGCRSGEKVEMSLSRGGAAEAVFAIAPTLGSDDLVDLHYKIDVVRDTKVVGGCNSAASLMLGVPSKLGTFGLKDSTSVDLIVTAQEQNK